MAWLRDFHRRRRSGLTGGDQLTEAVRVDGRIGGSVRLERLPTGDLEYGLWLARNARGQGLSSVLLDLVARRAVEAGAQRIVVRTTTDNGPAMATLRRAGAKIESGPGSEVSAVIDLLERG